jgi:hypothetical protein
MNKLNKLNKDALITSMDACRHNPQLFSDNFLGTPEKTEYQKNTFNLLLNSENHRVVVYSSNAMGKTHLLAESLLTAYYIWGPGIEIVITAPTWNIVKNVIFSELRNIYANAKVPLGGEINLTELKSKDDPQWFIIGFSPKISTSKDLATFRGFHGPKKTIIVFEEGVGVPAQLYEEAEMMMTGRDCHWWIITNTTDPTSEVAKLQSRSDWVKVRWDSFKSPNVLANGIKNIEDLREEVAYVLKLDDTARNERFKNYKCPFPSLLTLRWIVEKYIEWGEDSYLFQSYCLARFPENSDDTLISLKRIQECMGVYGDPVENGFAAYNGDTCIYSGNDIARYGSDMTVSLTFQGNKFLDKKVYSKKDTIFVAGQIKDRAMTFVKKDNLRVRVGIDETGVGGGVYDQFANDPDTRNNFIELHGFEFGSSARNNAKYANLISEMWAMTADDFKSESGFILEKDELLMNELASRKYKYIIRGGRTLMAIESKDDYKKRIGKSPDNADAFVIMNAMRHWGPDSSETVENIKKSYDTLDAILTKQEGSRDW